VSDVTCKEFILDFLSDYLESVLSPEAVAGLEAHLARCPACVAYLNTYRHTRALTREAMHLTMPEDMKAILRSFCHDAPGEADPVMGARVG
jgi:anti-sigma factor RsiW